MTTPQHLRELHSVISTMIQISKYTVDETGTLPDNVLRTIHGLQEYYKAVRRNPEFVSKALSEPPQRLRSVLFGFGFVQCLPHIKYAFLAVWKWLV